ncbi:MAG: DUF3592 domain-containing protein [Pseudomonadota bacterium]
MEVVLYLALLVVIVFFLIELRTIIWSLLSAKWPTCIGVLDKWNIQRDEMKEGATVIDSLKYKYSVSGKEYTSESIGFGFPTVSLYSQRALDKAFENAPNVTVYYRRSKPNESVIVTGIRAYHSFRLFVITIVICFIYVSLINL